MINYPTKIATAAVAMTLAVGPAQARTGAPVVVQQATAEPAAGTGEKKYCVRTTISGSRMPQKVCRTRKMWLAEGFDPTSRKD